MAAAEEPKVRPLLPFSDAWELRTRPFAFESATRSDASNPMSLNHLRDMTGQRNSACVRETSKLTCSPETREWFRKYLSNLDHFIKEEGRRTDMVFEWTSPLSGRFFKMAHIDGAEKERAMATFLYGGLLRELAHQQLNDMLGLSPGAQPLEGDARVAAITEITSLLRQAAGVFTALSERLLPAITGLKADRPFELLPGAAAGMASISLAEAQQLAALRLEERGGSAATVASLQAAAAELYDKALRELKSDGAEKEISDRAKRYLGCAAALTAARAHKHNATEQAAQLQAGNAERACVEAKSLLQAALNAADVDAEWRAVLEAESKLIEGRRVGIEKDRLYVSMQPIPREAPALPAGKLLVSPVAWEGEAAAGVSAEVARRRKAGRRKRRHPVHVA